MNNNKLLLQRALIFISSESPKEMAFKLIVKEVVKQFKQGTEKKTVLDGVSFVCEQGKTYGLVGASGSGKSTLMHLCAGLDMPTTGQVFLQDGGRQLYVAPTRAAQVVLVTQKPLLIKELSVLENVALSAKILGVEDKEADERAHEYLEKVGLADMRFTSVGALSGGQQQRAAVARALAVKPAFLCADEPTGSLDEETGQELIELLLACQKENNMGLLISSHNAAVIAQMEVVFVLKDGILVTR